MYYVCARLYIHYAKSLHFKTFYSIRIYFENLIFSFIPQQICNIITLQDATKKNVSIPNNQILIHLTLWILYVSTRITALRRRRCRCRRCRLCRCPLWWLKNLRVPIRYIAQLIFKYADSLTACPANEGRVRNKDSAKKPIRAGKGDKFMHSISHCFGPCSTSARRSMYLPFCVCRAAGSSLS